jgi:quercetin dioxygenase-like cupin family protein
MAVDIYEQCINPITGETFKGLTTTPYAFSMQWTTKPTGHVPLEHIHDNQDEIFRVKKGELKLLIEGKEHIAGPGEMIIVGKGKRHAAFNNTDNGLDILIEYRPALDQEKIIQCYCGLINDGYVDEKGSVSVPMMGYMLKKMKCKAMTHPAGISMTKFKIKMMKFYLKGTLEGWGKLYKKYTQ